MVSLPDFDPNAPVTRSEGRSPLQPRHARRLRDGLDLQDLHHGDGARYRRDDAAPAATTPAGPIRVGRFTISDYHARSRWLSVPEIFIHSSNIGAAQMALDIGPARQQQYLQRFGLLQPDRTSSCPRSARRMAPDPWREINTMTIAFGHGIAVTPLQLVTGVGAVVNGGILRPADAASTSSRTSVPSRHARAISPKTSAADARADARWSCEYGTGRRPTSRATMSAARPAPPRSSAAAATSQNARIASFVGAFPMDRAALRRARHARRAEGHQADLQLRHRRLGRRAGGRRDRPADGADRSACRRRTPTKRRRPTRSRRRVPSARVSRCHRPHPGQAACV